uniref:Secreted protein n=1 Tax=Arundo donax TaxID=35708 RepID=A0A0A9FPT5_ARUDO
MWVLPLTVMIMLFEKAVFTDIPHLSEWSSLAEKWRRCNHCIPCQKDALKQGALLSYSSCCSSCKFRKQPFGCKVSVTYRTTFFFFFLLCCVL